MRLLITIPSLIDLKKDIITIFVQLNEWFSANSLCLNCEKTHSKHFITKSNSFIDIVVSLKNKLITSTSNSKFLGIVIENSLSWKAHIDQFIPKLCTACYAITAIKSFMSLDTLQLVYYSYFHCLINYGIIFWGNSSHSIHIFRLQTRVIRIITGSRTRDSCRELFIKLKILPLQSLYILSLLLFVLNNKDKYKLNSEFPSKNSRQNSDLLPATNLTAYPKGTYFGIKICNNLTSDIKNCPTI